MHYKILKDNLSNGIIELDKKYLEQLAKDNYFHDMCRDYLEITKTIIQQISTELPPIYSDENVKDLLNKYTNNKFINIDKGLIHKFYYYLNRGINCDIELDTLKNYTTTVENTNNDITTTVKDFLYNYVSANLDIKISIDDNIIIEGKCDILSESTFLDKLYIKWFDVDYDNKVLVIHCGEVE